MRKVKSLKNFIDATVLKDNNPTAQFADCVTDGINGLRELEESTNMERLEKDTQDRVLP
jgi:hypothetical protein